MRYWHTLPGIYVSYLICLPINLKSASLFNLMFNNFFPIEQWYLPANRNTGCCVHFINLTVPHKKYYKHSTTILKNVQYFSLSTLKSFAQHFKHSVTDQFLKFCCELSGLFRILRQNVPNRSWEHLCEPSALIPLKFKKDDYKKEIQPPSLQSSPNCALV